LRKEKPLAGFATTARVLGALSLLFSPAYKAGAMFDNLKMFITYLPNDSSINFVFSMISTASLKKSAAKIRQVVSKKKKTELKFVKVAFFF
jgi:hypothetical protein